MKRGSGLIAIIAIVWVSMALVTITTVCVSNNPKWALLMLIPGCMSFKTTEDNDK